MISCDGYSLQFTVLILGWHPASTNTHKHKVCNELQCAVQDRPILHHFQQWPPKGSDRHSLLVWWSSVTSFLLSPGCLHACTHTYQPAFPQQIQVLTSLDAESEEMLITHPTYELLLLISTFLQPWLGRIQCLWLSHYYRMRSNTDSLAAWCVCVTQNRLQTRLNVYFTKTKTLALVATSVFPFFLSFFFKTSLDNQTWILHKILSDIEQTLIFLSVVFISF